MSDFLPVSQRWNLADQCTTWGNPSSLYDSPPSRWVSNCLSYHKVCELQWKLSGTAKKQISFFDWRFAHSWLPLRDCSLFFFLHSWAKVKLIRSRCKSKYPVKLLDVCFSFRKKCNALCYFVADVRTRTNLLVIRNRSTWIIYDASMWAMSMRS